MDWTIFSVDNGGSLGFLLFEKEKRSRIFGGQVGSSARVSHVSFDHSRNSGEDKTVLMNLEPISL